MYNKTYKVMPNGAVHVDAGRLLASDKVKKTLKDADKLYETLKREGYDVKKVGE